MSSRHGRVPQGLLYGSQIMVPHKKRAFKDALLASMDQNLHPQMTGAFGQEVE
jgi:hypothetical protein